MLPRNLISQESKEGMEDETLGWSDAFETGKGAVFIDLTLKITIERDLRALHSRLAQVRGVMHLRSRVWVSETVEDIRLRSSVKARSKDNAVLLVVNLETLTCIEYFSLMFISAKKIIIERVQPATIPR